MATNAKSFHGRSVHPVRDTWDGAYRRARRAGSQQRSSSMPERPTMTTTSGLPVADNQNTITAGPRGPVLLQDFLLFEKLAHHNTGGIPAHAHPPKGAA